VSGPRLLVVRNDRLGDFVLSWPALALLRAGFPEARLCVLVAEAVREAAELAPGVDLILADEGPLEGLRAAPALARRLRPERFDALLALYSTSRTGLAGLLARIPYRLAPATKLAQFTYTRRLVQRRSRAEKSEWEYGLDLARELLSDFGRVVPPDPQPPFLRFDPGATAELEARFRRAHGFDPDLALLFVHPGHGGSSPNLSLARWTELARGLAAAPGRAIVVTAGPSERAKAEAVAAGLAGLPHAVHESTEGLRRFAEHLAFAELFASGSTGVLHLAGALDRPTAGFFPRRRSASPARWRPLNSPGRHVAFVPPPEAGERELDAIDVRAAAAEISARLLAPRGSSRSPSRT
jgi:ADP-heptose:LPS heptosyltransferase